MALYVYTVVNKFLDVVIQRRKEQDKKFMNGESRFNPAYEN